MNIVIGNDDVVTAAVKIKRRHRSSRSEIKSAVISDLTNNYGINADQISVNFHEKGLANISGSGVTLRYKLDSFLNPVMVNM